MAYPFFRMTTTSKQNEVPEAKRRVRVTRGAQNARDTYLKPMT